MALKITRRATLDLRGQGHQVTIPFYKTDRGAYEVIFTVRDGTEVVRLPPGVRAAITVHNGADGGIVDCCVVSHVDNTVSYTPTPEALSVAGCIACYLHLYDERGAKLGAPGFIFRVAENDGDEVEAEVEAALVANNTWGLVVSAEENAKAVEGALYVAEGYVLGTENGVAVGEESPYYQNNAAYHAGVAEAAARASEEARSAAGGYAQQTKTEAENTAKKVEEANAKALVAEGHAHGTQNGVAVGADSPYYQKNAAYYAEVAEKVSENAEKVNAEALVSEGYARGTQNGKAVEAGSTYYQKNAAHYAGVAELAADASIEAKNAAASHAQRAETAADFSEEARSAAERYAQQVETAEQNTAEKVEEANAKALMAEGHARGTQNGVAVGAESPYYQNNAAYYAEVAEKVSENAEKVNAEALISEGYARGTQKGVTVGENSPYYQNNAEYFAELADAAAEDAAEKVEDANAEALVAEGHARGTENGVAVGEESPYYQNNAAYHAGVAEAASEAAAEKVEEANAKALVAEGYALGTRNGQSIGLWSPYYQNNAKHYAKVAETAAGASEDAKNDAARYAGVAESAAASAMKVNTDTLKAEGYALGTQNGQPVVPFTPYYQNNAKHYAKVAETAAGASEDAKNAAADYAKQAEAAAENVDVTREDLNKLRKEIQQGLCYELSADTENPYCIVTGKASGFTGSEIVIPDTFQGVPVTHVADGAFRGDGTITKIVFGANIEYIGLGAIANMENLSDIRFTKTEDSTPHSMAYGYFIYCAHGGATDHKEAYMDERLICFTCHYLDGISTVLPDAGENVYSKFLTALDVSHTCIQDNGSPINQTYGAAPELVWIGWDCLEYQGE